MERELRDEDKLDDEHEHGRGLWDSLGWRKGGSILSIVKGASGQVAFLCVPP